MSNIYSIFCTSSAQSIIPNILILIGILKLFDHWMQLGFSRSSQPPLSPRWLPAHRSPENALTVKIKSSPVIPNFLFQIFTSLPGLLQWTTWSPYKGTKGWSSTGSSWESREEPRCLPQWTESTSLCSPPETVGELFSVEEREFCLKSAWAEGARKQYVIQSYFQLLTQEKPEEKRDHEEEEESDSQEVLPLRSDKAHKNFEVSRRHFSDLLIERNIPSVNELL